MTTDTDFNGNDGNDIDAAAATTERRSRSINWSKTYLTNDFRNVAAEQPLPSEEAADHLDGPVPDAACAAILSFLQSLPLSMREPLMRCLLVGDLRPNVSQLAEAAGVSRPTWYAHLKKASMKVWGSPVPPWRRLGFPFQNEEGRVRPDSRGAASRTGRYRSRAHARTHEGSQGPHEAKERLGAGPRSRGRPPRPVPSSERRLMIPEAEARSPDCLTKTDFCRGLDSSVGRQR